MSKKSTKQAAGQKSGGDQSKQTSAAARGREHTIAKGVKAMGTSQQHPATPDEPAAETLQPAKVKEPKASGQTEAPVQLDDSTDMVVLAFRVQRCEREAFHAASGPAKASKILRAFTVAVGKGDGDALQQILTEVHQPSR